MTEPYEEPDLLDSGHPDDPTAAEALDSQIARAAKVTRAAVAGGPLALTGLVLGLVSFVVGESGLSVTVLRSPEDSGFGRLEAESFSAVAAIMAGVGLVAGIIAVITTRGGERTWRRDAAIAAVLVCALSAGLHAALWVFTIYHHATPARTNF